MPNLNVSIYDSPILLTLTREPTAITPELELCSSPGSELFETTHLEIETNKVQNEESLEVLAEKMHSVHEKQRALYTRHRLGTFFLDRKIRQENEILTEDVQHYTEEKRRLNATYKLGTFLLQRQQKQLKEEIQHVLCSNPGRSY